MTDFTEWIGYLASVLILISMLMSSILKLRIVNLTGAALFSAYGFLIDSLPVALLNLFVVIANAYYLIKMWKNDEKFSSIQMTKNDEYFQRFYAFHKHDIQKHFPYFEMDKSKPTYSFFILRDMAVAGLFVASSMDETTLKVELDYVLSTYRDLKPGKFLHQNKINTFKADGYNKLVYISPTNNHKKYLKQIGFVLDSEHETEQYSYSF